VPDVKGAAAGASTPEELFDLLAARATSGKSASAPRAPENPKDLKVGERYYFPKLNRVGRVMPDAISPLNNPDPGEYLPGVSPERDMGQQVISIADAYAEPRIVSATVRL